jgi:hypothetical protein
LHNKIIQKRLNRELIEKIEKQIEENRRKKKTTNKELLETVQPSNPGGR